MDEILAALEDDYRIDVLYSTPRDGKRTIHITYGRDTPPPDRYACPVDHCQHGGFDLAAIVVGIGRPRLAALQSDSMANRTVDERVERVCEGFIPVKDHPDVKCTQTFTVRFRATLKLS
jgi:hypothetical protein